MNLYDLLGIKRDATKGDIKKAYRREAQKAHPDKPGGDEETFHGIQVAYDVLGDPERRAAYDETGSIDEKPKNEVESGLIALFNSVIMEDKFDGDIIKTCAERLNISIKFVNNEIFKSTSRLAKLSGQLDRIVFTGELNLYEQMLSSTIDGLTRELEGSESDRDKLVAIKESLEEYSDSKPSEKSRFHGHPGALGDLGQLRGHTGSPFG